MKDRCAHLIDCAVCGEPFEFFAARGVHRAPDRCGPCRVDGYRDRLRAARAARRAVRVEPARREAVAS